MNYFRLQYKRLGTLLPKALCALMALLLGLGLALHSLIRLNENSEKNRKLTVAVCGVADDSILQMGITAIQSLDELHFSLEVVEMEEPDAIRAIERGDISAYAVIPEGFMHEAMNGHILTVRFVSAANAQDLSAILSDEITDVIGQVLLAAQKGTYGTGESLLANGLDSRVGAAMDEVSLAYITFLLQRANAHQVVITGIGNSLTLPQYLITGFSILFLFLICLPFAPVMIQGDPALERMLFAKGQSTVRLTLAKFAAWVCALLTLLLAILFLLPIAAALFHLRFSALAVPLLKGLPVAILTAAVSFFLYTLASDLIGGIIMQFFTSLAMCFVCGCLYPVFFFPESLQKLSRLLPAGIAREYLAQCVLGEVSMRSLAVISICAGIFAAASCAVYRHKIVHGMGVRQ